MKPALIKVELDLAITYSKIALESDSEEKIAKHRASARIAYDNALRSLRSLQLTQNEEVEITKKLVAVKAELEGLGERF